MKLPRLFLFTSLVFACAFPALLSAAEEAKTAAGYWAGTLTTPRGDFPLSVEFSQDKAGAWQAIADYPFMGVRGLKADAVKVTDTTVEFVCLGLPNEPRLNGKLAADGKSIAGEVGQGEAALPFHLERKPKPALGPDPFAVPATGVAGEGLVGKWRGSIKPAPAIELRLELELTADASGKIGGVVISLDQGGSRIPIGTLTEKDGEVQFDTPRVRGSFHGKLNADGSELAGEWTQGRPTPLVFKRLASTK